MGYVITLKWYLLYQIKTLLNYISHILKILNFHLTFGCITDYNSFNLDFLYQFADSFLLITINKRECS